MAYGAIMGQQAAGEGGYSAIVESYPVASGFTINAGDVVDVVDGQIQKIIKSGKIGDLNPGDTFTLPGKTANSKAVCILIMHDYGGSGNSLCMLNSPYTSGWSGDDSGYQRYNYIRGDAHAGATTNLQDNLSSEVYAAIPNTTFEYTRPTSNTVSNISTSSAKGFLFSGYELNGNSGESDVDDLGPQFPDAARQAIRNIMKIYGSNIDFYTRSMGAYTGFEGGRAVGLAQYTSGSSGIFVEGTISFGTSERCLSMFSLPPTFQFEETVDQSNQAIALQSGTGGQSIKIAFSGNVAADWATEGLKIESDGVEGYAPVAGMLSVIPGANRAKQVTGSYIGTGTYGASNPNTLTFDFAPKLVIIMGTGKMATFVYDAAYGMLVTTISNKSNYTLTATWENNTLSWYSSDGKDYQMNEMIVYNYIAIG